MEVGPLSKSIFMQIKSIFLLLLMLLLSKNIVAQVTTAFFEGERIASVNYIFKNQSLDSVSEKKLMQTVKLNFPVVPQTILQTILLDAYISKIKNLPQIKEAQYEVTPSQIGGVDITLTVLMGEVAKQPKERSGLLIGEKDFPVLYMDSKSLLTTKFALSQMIYTNNNSWYAREDAMLQGNPLVNNPAGEGYTGWIEGWFSGGIYGITTVSTKNNLYLYGGISYILSGTAGRELFTDESRFHGEMEDGYIGFLATKKYESGNKLLYNIILGRKQFSIGQGFIIRNTASNGDNRAALQLNPRWAADFLGLGSIKFNNLLFQAFYLDPNELPLIDNKTTINGLNLELGKNGNTLGLLYLNVPKSNFKYFTPTGDVFAREGLHLYNIRFYKNKAAGESGLFYKGEFAYENNSNFEMEAYAGYIDLGWNLVQNSKTTVLRYRYAYFSGDNPNTEKYERWDPLLSGGNGEEWVIGANHFKLVQNSNMLVHQLQANFRPWSKIELVPQAMYLYAAQKNNIGGNPALSSLSQKEYGYEFNISAKYFPSKKWYWHGHLAYTIPGEGARLALNNTAKSWWSAMVFFRYSL
jgi:hypothetical protein